MKIKSLSLNYRYALLLTAAAGIVGALLSGCGSSNTSSSPTFSVGGTVTGLASGSQVSLADNNGPPLALSANGVFTFPAAIAQNGAYSVTVTTQPAKQVCTVTNASGSNVQANVSSVGVSCVTHNLYVGDSGAAKIYQFALASNGTLAPLTAPSVTAPGNIGQVILDNTGSYLYATIPNLNEVAQYSVAPDGSLTAMATPIIPASTAPYEEAASPDGKWLFVGDQGGFSVDSYAIGTSGALTHVGTYSCGNPGCSNVQGLAVDATSSHL